MRGCPWRKEINERLHLNDRAMRGSHLEDREMRGYPWKKKINERTRLDDREMKGCHWRM
jgi:hypothetical protein